MKTTYNGLSIPVGDRIVFENGKPIVPNNPIIPFITGDGIGADITRAMQKVVNAAVRKAYGDERAIRWFEVFAAEGAHGRLGTWLPDDTVEALRDFGVSIKGPLATPTGGGYRSVNVRLRKLLDLYKCVRPVRWYRGVPSAVLSPEKLDIVIFRENIEDVYAGIEFAAGSPEAELFAKLLAVLGHEIRPETGIGIKIQSREGTRRIVRAAIQYAIDNGRKTVTIVHKGNIQKFTEGAFRNWAFELALEEFRDQIVTVEELWSAHDGKLPEGKILVNEIIADALFNQALIAPESLSVVVLMNLNGDYFSDAAAAQVGGLGMAPGANIGDNYALFEATHGTAASLANKDVANPGSLILSAVMMLRFLGWEEAASLVDSALETTIEKRTVTKDLADKMPGSTVLKTSEFADAIVANMPADDVSASPKPEVASPAAGADSSKG